jgi:ASC-1-like (ASCH) protein
MWKYVNPEETKEVEIGDKIVVMRPMNWQSRQDWQMIMLDMKGGKLSPENLKDIDVENVRPDDALVNDAVEIMRELPSKKKRMDELLARHIIKLPVGEDDKILETLQCIDDETYWAIVNGLYGISAIKDNERKN